MGNTATNEILPDSYIYDPIVDFEKDDSPYNFKLKSFPILHPSNETLLESIRIETEILKLSELEVDREIWIEDIPIDFYGENFIHTIRAQENKYSLDKSKPTMIFVHGYNSSCVHYIKMLKKFYKEFNLFAIDLIGMGFSSRPQPDFKDSKDYINFFIDSIEAFRIKIFKDYSEEDNKKFYLIGHSLGGYLSTNYSIKYPKYIIKLFLLSPVGITDMENNTEENEESNSFRKTFRDSIICLIWPLKTTLQNLVNNFLFKNSIKNGLLNRYTIDQKETELFRDLTFHCLANYPKDLDHAIYYILKLPLPMAIWPLENVIPKRIKDFSIDIIYGSDDWMESKGAKRIYENQKNKKESITSKINLYYMRSGRHTFNLERPIDTSRYILNGIKIDEFNKSKISNPNENILYNQDSKLNELLDI